MQGEIAGELEFFRHVRLRSVGLRRLGLLRLQAFAFKSNGRVLRDVEKVWAAQMVVAFCVVRVDAGRIDRELDLRVLWLFLVEAEGARIVFEFSAHFRKEMANFEVNA